MNRKSRIAVGTSVVCLCGFAVLVLVSGCPMTAVPPAGGDRTSPAAAELFSLITASDPYEQWARFPGFEGTFESAAPHGPRARVFINEKVEQAMLAFDGTLPDGAIIVKENIGASEGDKAEALTVMWKVSGFDPNNNDWFWANISSSGEVNAEGQVVGCMSCHGGAQANDYVFMHQF